MLTPSPFTIRHLPCPGYSGKGVEPGAGMWFGTAAAGSALPDPQHINDGPSHIPTPNPIQSAPTPTGSSQFNQQTHLYRIKPIIIRNYSFKIASYLLALYGFV